MTPVPMDEALERYIAWWQGVPGTLVDTESVIAPNGRFVDPFTDVRGSAAVRHHLEKAYGKLHDVRITVSDRAFSGRIAYMRWTFALRMRPGGPMRAIAGMSEVHFGDDGRVSLHYDHWDAASQVYEHIPVLGAILRAARARINR